MNRRVSLAILVLAGALLACTLSWGSDEETESGQSVPVAGAQTIPSVRIISPVDGDLVPVNQRVDITVETDSTATSFLLSVDGKVAGSKALPSDQSGPASAILTWQSGSAGSYTLQVTALNGPYASVPVSVTVQASESASSGGTDSQQASGACSGTVLVSQLNFRGAPGTDTTRLGQFDVGETVTVIGRNAARTWYQVRRSGQDVWVISNDQWLRVEGACDALPTTG